MAEDSRFSNDGFDPLTALRLPALQLLSLSDLRLRN